MSTPEIVGEWMLAVGCLLAAALQAAALRSPDVLESEVACALRRIKVAAWSLLGARLLWLMCTVGELPIGFLSLAPLLLLTFADCAWPLLRLVERGCDDPRTSAPGAFDSVPHHHWGGVIGRGKDTP